MGCVYNLPFVGLTYAIYDIMLLMAMLQLKLDGISYQDMSTPINLRVKLRFWIGENYNDESR